MKELKDLIYFDKEKALSIYSQLNEGLTQEKSESHSAQKGKKRTLGFDLFKVFKPSFEKSSSIQEVESESKILHHDLLNTIEKELVEIGALFSFKEENYSDIDFNKIRGDISNYAYLNSEGWTVFEDYARLDFIASKFNALNVFVNRCVLGETEIPEEIKKLEEEIDDFKKQIKEVGDRNQKAKEIKRAQSIEKKLEKTILELTNAEGIDNWLIDGIHLFIDTFLPNRVNMRLFPIEEHPDFQILANLKKNCFVDDDFDNFLFSYGAEPNVKLKILGLVTSIPPEFGQVFDTMAEYDLIEEDQLTEKEGMERAFRNMFRQFDNLEQFARYSRYPNITISPIAVYREIKAAHNKI